MIFSFTLMLEHEGSTLVLEEVTIRVANVAVSNRVTGLEDPGVAVQEQSTDLQLEGQVEPFAVDHHHQADNDYLPILAVVPPEDSDYESDEDLPEVVPMPARMRERRNALIPDSSESESEDNGGGGVDNELQIPPEVLELLPPRYHQRRGAVLLEIPAEMLENLRRLAAQAPIFDENGRAAAPAG